MNEKEIIKYVQMLENSYNITKQWDVCLDKKLEYLANYIFDFITYDGEMAELFSQKALEVCKAITDKKTFEYIEDKENYKWFLLMCNMPFFSEKIEWGTSIRGAWWDSYDGIILKSCGIYEGDEQKTEIKFDEQSWHYFINAMILWCNVTDQA